MKDKIAEQYGEVTVVNFRTLFFEIIACSFFFNRGQPRGYLEFICLHFFCFYRASAY